MKTAIFTVLASASIFGTIPQVQAWGALGHQTVALLAQSYLLPSTVTKVQAILNDTSSSYMANVATWADQYRSEPGGRWSAGLHFVDPTDGPPPESCVIHEMEDCPAGGCVMSALANYTARVQDNTLSAADRAEAMRFIIHFMGDIAQPLHTEAFGLGANNISVTFNSYQTNMHAAWDTSIPNSIMSLAPTASITMTSVSAFSSKLHTAISSTSGAYHQNYTNWVDSWQIKSSAQATFNLTESITTAFAQESNNYVCEYALSDPRGPDAYDGTEISGAYTQGAIPIVEISLARAGVRLAAWLNLIFAGKTGF